MLQKRFGPWFISGSADIEKFLTAQPAADLKIAEFVLEDMMTSNSKILKLKVKRDTLLTPKRMVRVLKVITI